MPPSTPTTAPKSPAPGAPVSRGTPPPPPEWALERLVKSIGRGPAAVGRMLDRAAKAPLIGPVVRLFSSVWFGIAILTLIGLYIAIGSGNPELRARLEMTDLQFFDWWPMRILLVLLTLDLSIVTLRRIPLTLFKLGSWTVHVGILTLVGGCVWYFSHKQEGSVRVYLHQSAKVCYDVTERALYAFPMKSDGSFDVEHAQIVPLPTLPIYYEHLAETGNPLAIGVEGLLPGTQVTVKGYYPCAVPRISDVRAALPGEEGVGPGIELSFRTATGGGTQWLLAATPATRLFDDPDAPLAIEYLRQPTAERVRDLQASFDGAAAITVRIAKLGIERVYPVKLGTPIVVEGSGYTLTPKDVTDMPMASKGYQGTHSSVLAIDVSRKEGDGTTFSYTRNAVFRYPERSPDFVNGQRKQDGVDPDIQIIYHDALRTQAWIVEDAQGARQLIVRTTDGKSTSQPISEAPIALGLKQEPTLKLWLSRAAQNAAYVMAPSIVPPEQRPRSQTAMEVMQLSMVELELRKGAWSQGKVYVPFSPYAAIASGDPAQAAQGVGKPPTVVDVPGVGRVGLLLATTQRELPSTITLRDFKAVKYPGAMQTYADYVSTLESKDDAGTRTLVAHLNNPASDHGLFYFQAGWSGAAATAEKDIYSVLGVGNRPGIYVMIAGSILMVLGIGYAFYIKPLLLKKKKEELAAWAKGT